MCKNSARIYLSLLLSIFFLAATFFPASVLASLPTPSKIIIIEKDCKDFKGNNCVSLEEFKRNEAVPFETDLKMLKERVSEDEFLKVDANASIAIIEGSGLDLTAAGEKSKVSDYLREKLSSKQKSLLKIEKRRPLLEELIGVYKESLEFLESKVQDPKDIAAWQYKKHEAKKRLEEISQKLNNINNVE